MMHHHSPVKNERSLVLKKDAHLTQGQGYVQVENNERNFKQNKYSYYSYHLQPEENSSQQLRLQLACLNE